MSGLRDRVGAVVERREWPLVAALGLLALAVRLVFAPYARLFRADEFSYLIKALEILRGNWVPVETHAIGWSVVLAPVLGLFPTADFHTQTILVRVCCCLIGAAAIIPLHLLAREVLDRRTGRVLLLLFACAVFPVVFSGSAMAEAPFSLLLVASIAAAVRAAGRPGSAWWVGLWAGLSYWVRLNGLYVLAAAVAIMIWDRRRPGGVRPRHLVAACLVFLAVASPVAIQRARAFGSPFHFGYNSKYFVETYRQVISPNVPIPTARQYLATHGVGNVFSRFVVRGALMALWDFAWYGIGPHLLAFFALGLLALWRTRAVVPVVAIVVAWVVCLTPVYDLWRADRFLWPTIPLLLIPIAAGMTDLARRAPRRRYVLAAMVVAYCAISLGLVANYRHIALQEPLDDGAKWGRWIAQHAKGRVIVLHEPSFIVMHLPDASAGGAGYLNMYAPVSGISTVTPADASNLRDAMRWHRQAGDAYLVVDDDTVREWPYLAEISPAAPPPYMQLVYSNVESTSRWKVRVYRFDWSR